MLPKALAERMQVLSAPPAQHPQLVDWLRLWDLYLTRSVPFVSRPVFKPIRLGKISQPFFTPMSGVMTAIMDWRLGWAAVVI